MKNKTHTSDLKFRFSVAVIVFYVIVAVLAPILANNKPLYFSASGTSSFPAFSKNPYIQLPDSNGMLYEKRISSIDWSNYKTGIIFPPVAWHPVNADLKNILTSPFDDQYRIYNGQPEKIAFRFRHFLGTGNSGNDVLAALIHGCRTSLAIGFFSILLAFLPGLIIGSLAGYCGDELLKIRRGNLLLILILLIPAWFYSFYLRSENISNAFSSSPFTGVFQIVLSTIIFLAIVSPAFMIRFSFFPFLNKRICIPVDSLLSRCIEIFISLPRLILILTIVAISRPSLATIILIIGFTSWTEIARMVRGQFLLLRQMNYVSAAVAIGNKKRRVIFYHMLPNVLPQLAVVGIFGIAGAILIETGLSFLGAGVPANMATWGSLMFQARENYQAWWLVIFPGMALSILLMALYVIADHYKIKKKKQEFLFNKF